MSGVRCGGDGAEDGAVWADVPVFGASEVRVLVVDASYGVCVHVCGGRRDGMRGVDGGGDEDDSGAVQ